MKLIQRCKDTEKTHNIMWIKQDNQYKIIPFNNKVNKVSKTKSFETNKKKHWISLFNL